MKNVVLCDVMLYVSCMNRRHPDDRGDTFLRNVVFSRATLRNIPKDGILQQRHGAMRISEHIADSPVITLAGLCTVVFCCSGGAAEPLLRSHFYPWLQPVVIATRA
jgi:hypothetical protein